MSSYIGRHADYYDLVYASKDYRAEVMFIQERIVEFGNPQQKKILEIAAGTGNHALILEELGYQIRAIDLSPEMISRARKKAVETSSKIRFSVGDMRDPMMFDDFYDIVLCLFDSIGYVKDNASIKQVFKNVSTCLNPEGLFIFEFWHAAAMIKNYDPVRVKRFKLPGGNELLRISETSMDTMKQLCSVKYTLYEFLPDHKYSILEETQVNRFFLSQEMYALLEGSGLEPMGVYNGYSRSGTVNEDTFHIVMVCKKTK
jgi:SAM-dependent methyltransferase